MKWYLAFLLLLQILTSIGIFISLKFINIKKINKYHALIVNYIVAVSTSLLSIDWATGMKPESGNSLLSLWPAAIVGFLFMFNFLLMITSTEKVGVGLTSAFSKMSVLIPVLVGILFLGQTNNLTTKIIGVVLTLVSFFFILYNKGGHKKLSWAIILPISVFFFSGVADEAQELARNFVLVTVNDTKIFLFMVFLVALASCLILAIRDSVKNGFKFSWPAVAFGAMLGLFNYFTAQLLMANVNIFGGSIVFPIVNASTVLLTSIIGVLFFKEKLSRRQWIGIGIAVSAVVFIAISI